jgi:hypothetical protein
VHYVLVLIVLLGFKRIVLQDPRLRKQILFFVLVLMGAIFFTLPYSTFIWEHIQILRYLQFPCRFLTLVVLAGSFIAGGVVLLVQQKHRLIVAIITAVVIFGANFYYCHPRDTFICDLKEVKSDPDKYLADLVSQDTNEFIPIWVENGAKSLPPYAPSEKLQAYTEGAQVLDSREISPLRYKFRVLAEGDSIFLFHGFYYPGWVVKVDNKGVEIVKDNPLGLITFECQEGLHDVEIYFGTTRLRQIAQGITITSLGALVLIGLFLK